MTNCFYSMLRTKPCVSSIFDPNNERISFVNLCMTKSNQCSCALSFHTRKLALNCYIYLLPSIWQIKVADNPHMNFVYPLFVKASPKFEGNGEVIYKNIQLPNSSRDHFIFFGAIMFYINCTIHLSTPS